MSTKRRFFFIISLVSLTTWASVAWAEEIIVSMQKPFNFTNNTTLAVEDVDPQQGVVWLKIYNENETLSSAILSLGQHFSYRETDLALSKIYAGSEEYLVALDIGNRSSKYISVTEDNASTTNKTKKNAYPK